MATETVTLTADKFTQLTSGSQSAYIQVMTVSGQMLWADSATQPVVNAPAHLQTKEVVTGSNLTVWARAQSGKVTVTITRYTE